MILEELELLFEDLDIDEPTGIQMRQLYQIYLEEVCNIRFKEERIIVNNKPSRHPICRGKHQTFEHVITRESQYTGKRDFDRERANRIHWIKPIIEHWEDVRIKYFEVYNDKNQLQYFFFYEDRDFIVIIRQLPNGKMLVTAYCVDGYRRRGFKKQYEEYKNKKTPLRK